MGTGGRTWSAAICARSASTCVLAAAHSTSSRSRRACSASMPIASVARFSVADSLTSWSAFLRPAKISTMSGNQTHRAAPEGIRHLSVQPHEDWALEESHRHELYSTARAPAPKGAATTSALHRTILDELGVPLHRKPVDPGSDDGRHSIKGSLVAAFDETYARLYRLHTAVARARSGSVGRTARRNVLRVARRQSRSERLEEGTPHRVHG